MNSLIIEPFNTVFFSLLALAVLFCVIFVRTTRKKSLLQRKNAVIIMYSIVFIIYLLYKYALSIDAQFSALRMSNGYGAFNWFDELPLHLCNINIILVVIALFVNSRTILGLSFFSSFLGALAAILMPPAEFVGYSIMIPRMLGYYITHFSVLLILPILAGLDLYKPKYSDIKPVLTVFCATTIIITGINILFIKTGLDSSCNYFYTMNPGGISLLETLYNIIPIPWVYQLPLLIVIVPYMLVLTFFFNLKSS